MKRFSIIVLSTIVCIVVSIVGFTEGKYFTDVPADAWYYNDVQNAVNKGLINGKTTTTYAPDDNLTYAEAVKLAACMHKLSVEGRVDFETSTPWYMVFVEYAKEKSIISKDYAWEKKTTRAEYMDIFSKALPPEKLNEVNFIPDGAIHDVPMTHSYASAIYKMYRAGIVQGSDAQYSCRPSENIKRSEVAAILTRMMDASARKTFTITLPEYRILYNTGYAQYDAKINEYYQAMSADENTFDRNDFSSINGLMVGYARNSDDKLYYALYDIDKNGIPELIFSNQIHVIDLYTLNDVNLIKVFKDCYFGERSNLHILDDGTLLTEGSNGASSSSCKTFKLNSKGSLETTGAYYYNSDGPNAYMKGYIYISTNEYVDKVSNYISHSVFNSIEWKFFADMDLISRKSYYNAAVIAMNNGNYLAAAEQFISAGNYKDAGSMALECYYQYGNEQMELNYVTDGLAYLSKCRGYKDTDEIIQSYYYEEGKKAFDRCIDAFSGEGCKKAIDKLTLCEGYKDSNSLIRIIEKLNYVWTEMPYESNWAASLYDMSISVSEDSITIKKDNFISQRSADLMLKYNVKKQSFDAVINGFSAIGGIPQKSVLALIRLFTDIEKTDDLATKINDKYEWTVDDGGESFSINYGGYSISIYFDYTDRYDAKCSVSAKK